MINHTHKQLIIAHRGILAEHIHAWTDTTIPLILEGRVPDSYTSAKTFSKSVRDQLGSELLRYKFFEIGYSLGGVYATLCAHEFDCRAVVFDSPSLGHILKNPELRKNNKLREDALKEYQLTSYVTSPNIVNTSGSERYGKWIRLFVTHQQETPAKVDRVVYFSDHSEAELCLAFLKHDVDSSTDFEKMRELFDKNFYEPYMQAEVLVWPDQNQYRSWWIASRTTLMKEYGSSITERNRHIEESILVAEYCMLKHFIVPKFLASDDSDFEAFDSYIALCRNRFEMFGQLGRFYKLETAKDRLITDTNQLCWVDLIPCQPYDAVVTKAETINQYQVDDFRSEIFNDCVSVVLAIDDAACGLVEDIEGIERWDKFVAKFLGDQNLEHVDSIVNGDSVVDNIVTVTPGGASSLSIGARVIGAGVTAVGIGVPGMGFWVANALITGGVGLIYGGAGYLTYAAIRGAVSYLKSGDAPKIYDQIKQKISCDPVAQEDLSRGRMARYRSNYLIALRYNIFMIKQRIRARYVDLCPGEIDIFDYKQHALFREHKELKQRTILLPLTPSQITAVTPVVTSEERGQFDDLYGLGKERVATLEGHTEDVHALTVLPNESLASDGPSQVIEVWDLGFPVGGDRRRLSSAEEMPKNDQIDQKNNNDKADVFEVGKGIESLYIASQDVVLGRELGRGGFGIVYEGTYAFEPVAVKAYYGSRMPEKEAQEMRHEIEMMRQLHSRYLVRLIGFVHEEKSPIMLVMEYEANGSLYNFLHSKQDITWRLRLRMAEELARGLGFLHQKNILHRDIKSLNVVLDADFHAKWCDFGLAVLKLHSTTMSKAGDQSRCGTLRWMAPELFQDDEQSAFGTKTDIWALGMVYFELASRKTPYENLREQQVMAKLMRKKSETVPDECRHEAPNFGALMQRCWAERTARPTAAEVVTEMTQINGSFVEISPTVFQKATATVTAADSGYMDFSRS